MNHFSKLFFIFQHSFLSLFMFIYCSKELNWGATAICRQTLKSAKMGIEGNLYFKPTGILNYNCETFLHLG